jgi:L-asparaginase II
MKPKSPLVVEVTRGGRVESRHLVDVAVADARGKLHSAYGDTERPVFPRSAVKALQALPLIESGAADRFGFSDSEIALACSSHHGEAIHVETAARMLAKAGLQPACLECGAHWPKRGADRRELIRKGLMPTALHNNCSGKHSGFLALAAHSGWETRGYVGIDHRVQKAIADTMTQTTGVAHRAGNHGIDGCSIPTYAIPLDKLAVAYARFGVGDGEGPQRSAAMKRILDACFANPQMIAGKRGADTAFLSSLRGKAFTKTGAEGVHVAALPVQGLGIALKVHDGAARAAEVAIAMLVETLVELDETEALPLREFRNPVLTNWAGTEVGEIRTA